MSASGQTHADVATPHDAPISLAGLDGLIAHRGQHLGVTEWHTVTQGTVDAFADITDDRQWIHVDPERAASGPYGGTVQHRFLTLSHASAFLWRVCTIEGPTTVINYGLNKVRFPAPVRVGTRIRMHVTLIEAAPLLADGAEAVYRLTYEVENHQKPCCVADLVLRYYHLETKRVGRVSTSV